MREFDHELRQRARRDHDYCNVTARIAELVELFQREFVFTDTQIDANEFPCFQLLFREYRLFADAITANFRPVNRERKTGACCALHANSRLCIGDQIAVFQPDKAERVVVVRQNIFQQNFRLSRGATGQRTHRRTRHFSGERIKARRLDSGSCATGRWRISNSRTERCRRRNIGRWRGVSDDTRGRQRFEIGTCTQVWIGFQPLLQSALEFVFQAHRGLSACVDLAHDLRRTTRDDEICLVHFAIFQIDDSTVAFAEVTVR